MICSQIIPARVCARERVCVCVLGLGYQSHGQGPGKERARKGSSRKVVERHEKGYELLGEGRGRRRGGRWKTGHIHTDAGHIHTDGHYRDAVKHA